MNFHLTTWVDGTTEWRVIFLNPLTHPVVVAFGVN